MNNKKILKETSFELPVSKNILRYDDDIVIKEVKKIISESFNNITLESIIGEEGGAFYTMTLALELEEDIKDDLERKRFYISQIMSKFKSQFASMVSAVLPVVNVTTSVYQFSKNSNVLKFSCTLCLSHTNDRDWVSGVYRGAGEKNKKLHMENSASKKHAITAMPLNTAINAYNNGRLDKKMLETAIKACGRNELEFYVLRSVGIKADVDISDVNVSSKTSDDLNKHTQTEE